MTGPGSCPTTGRLSHICELSLNISLTQLRSFSQVTAVWHRRHFRETRPARADVCAGSTRAGLGSYDGGEYERRQDEGGQSLGGAAGGCPLPHLQRGD